DVLLRVPEGAVIQRVDCQIAVVSPTSQRARLAAGAGKECRFTLSQDIERVGKEPPGVTDLRVHRCARSTVAESKISLLVHGRTTHPKPGPVRLVGARRELHPA